MKTRTADRGMASFARFTVIFDADFQEQTVVLLDVHDDAETQLSYVKAACKSLVHTGKEAYFMYVKSDDTSCEYECSVHKTMHTHRDAGFSVWIPGSIRREYANAFRKFWLAVQTTYREYAYGSEEILMDYFLKTIPMSEKHLLLRNKFMACKCNKLPPTEVISSDAQFCVHENIEFLGKQDMFVCSRMEFS